MALDLKSISGCDLFAVYDTAFHIIDPAAANGPGMPTNMIIMGTFFV